MTSQTQDAQAIIDQYKAENERLKLRLWDLEHSEVDHVLRERDQLKAENRQLKEEAKWTSELFMRNKV